MASPGARRSAGTFTARARTTPLALVQAAVQALREVGFAGASARDIARRAGSTQSQVFYHFGSVADLLLAALDDVSARRMAAFQPLLEAATSPAYLLRTARPVVGDDSGSGELQVLVELVAGPPPCPGLCHPGAARFPPRQPLPRPRGPPPLYDTRYSRPVYEEKTRRLIQLLS